MTDTAMRVAVVGAGYMGRGIAQTLARAGARLLLIDREVDLARTAVASMIADVEAAERAGLVPPGAAETVRQNSEAGSFDAETIPAEVVIEAVFEDLEVKKEVLAAIEARVDDTAIIATNTSAIPVTELAGVLRHPERFFGVHWFNPAPYLPGIEIVLGERSHSELLDDLRRLLVQAGKSPVIVSDTPGFIANRLQFALFKEAALMVEEGSATPEQVDEVVKNGFGFRLPFFGPFAIADMAGLDVYASAFATLAAHLGPRFDCPPSLAARVASGDLGTKSGGGYLGLSREQAERLSARRDRSYVALSGLRASLEADGSE